MTYNLTDNEYNALQDITSINGMDCWFCLKQDKHGKDYIYDLEQRKRISITTALSYIYEGLLEEDFDALDNEEQEALDNLFTKFKINEESD